MCWIAFKKKESFKDYFTNAGKRGMDWFWIITKSLPTRKYYAEDLSDWSDGKGRWFIPVGKKKKSKFKFEDYEAFYNELLTRSLYKLAPTEFALIHHRKATSGSKSIENVHPFVWTKYTVLQNGTTKEFEWWGEIEGMEVGRPDSYYLGEWVNRQDSFDMIIEKLGKIKLTIGVIMVIDNTSKEILYYSDGARSFHFELNEAWYIEYASSLLPDGDDPHKNIGYMVFNFDWKIITHGIENVNQDMKPKMIQAPAYQWVKSINDKDDEYYKSHKAYKWVQWPFAWDGKWEWSAEITDPLDPYYPSEWYIWSHKEGRWQYATKEYYDKGNSVLEMFPEDEDEFPQYDILEELSIEIENIYEDIYDKPFEAPQATLQRYYELCSEIAEYDEELAEYYSKLLYEQV